MMVFYCLCLSMNIYLSIFICTRLYMLRHKAEKVLGTLQASLYNSSITMFVESGSFFTVWSLVYVISFAANGWVQDIFLQPYSYIIVSLFTLTDRPVSDDDVIGRNEDAYHSTHGARQGMVEGDYKCS